MAELRVRLPPGEGAGAGLVADRGTKPALAIDFAGIFIGTCTGLIRWCSGVLNQKFIGLFCGYGFVAVAEALDGRKDVVSRLGPAERRRLGIVLVAKRLECCLQRGDAAVRAGLDLAAGQQGEEPLDLVQL